MKKQFVIVSALACLFVSKNSFSQEKNEKVASLDEIIITATKFETNKKNIGKIVYKIAQETIQNSTGKTVLDLLNDVPGVQINGNFSTRGQNLGYYIRGGRNRQVAILIDGVNVNDPSSFAGDFDLRQIDIQQIESIEVLKGASSTLYGTGAATGVINIILKKASKNEFNGTFTSSIGSNSSAENNNLSAEEFSTNFNFNGTIGKIEYLLALNANGSGGLSALENTDKSNPFNEDIFARQNALLKIEYSIRKHLKLGFFGSFDEFSTDFDSFDSTTNAPLDSENSLNSIQKRAGLNADFSYKNGSLKLRTFITDIERLETPSANFFYGKVLGFDIYNHYKISNKLSFLTGFTSQFQDMEQLTSFGDISRGAGKQHFYDPYFSIDFLSDKGFNFSTGIRLNVHNEYGENWVFNINPSFNFQLTNQTNARLFASYSTAFVTPTLSEIFTKLPSIDRLLPEEIINIETGVELNFSTKISFNTTIFYREETNKIGYDFITYQTINNFGTFLARGIESEVSYKPLKKLHLLANYTFIDRAENLLIKIPQNTFFLKADYQLFPETYSAISYRFVDETKDFGNLHLASYNLVDFFINHKLLAGKVTFYGSITNLFNENFQEIAGYTTRGRNYNLGLKIQL